MADGPPTSPGGVPAPAGPGWSGLLTKEHHTPRRARSPLASTRPQPRTLHRHFAVHGAQNRRATVLVAQGCAAAPTMGLAQEPPLHLFRNQLGLHLGQQRPPLREGQAQLGKTLAALNYGQNSVAVIDRVAVLVGQPCFDDQPHGLLPQLRYRSAYPTRSRRRTQILEQPFLGASPTFARSPSQRLTTPVDRCADIHSGARTHFLHLGMTRGLPIPNVPASKLATPVGELLSGQLLLA